MLRRLALQMRRLRAGVEAPFQHPGNHDLKTAQQHGKGAPALLTSRVKGSLLFSALQPLDDE